MFRLPIIERAMNQAIYKKIALVVLLLTTAVATAVAQRTLTGVLVSSEDKEPIIGASVSVSETQLKKAGSTAKRLGTVTDIDGRFKLTVPDAVTEIECRSIGFNPRTIELVDGVNDYDLLLDPSSEVLSDVVVTGYQAIERRKLTASITKMEIDDSKIGSIMNIDQALAGQVGVLVAGGTGGEPAGGVHTWQEFLQVIVVVDHAHALVDAGEQLLAVWHLRLPQA